MSPFQTLLTALRELALHKFRSGLATLGVIFGVASVMAMLSISEGAKRQTLERIAALGIDNLILRSTRPPRTTTADPSTYDEYRQSMKYGLKRDDLNHIRSTFQGIRYAVGTHDVRRETRFSNGRQAPDVKIIATEPDYLKVTRSSMQRGRFLSDWDEDNKQSVCVIGVEAARKIFAFADPMGQTISIDKDWYEVVGILRNTANLKEAGGDDINNMIFIPMSTSHARYGDLSYSFNAGASDVSSVELDSIILQMEKDEHVDPTSARVRRHLAATHPKPDYEVLVPKDLMNQKAATQRIFTVVMASIASISLLVGGIGIMNIMLANVSDRRREIGTRRALGARRIDIITQFLFEAAALTTLGGAVGVALGYVLSRSISSYADWPVTISPDAIVLGLGVSCVSGLVFGFWPAWQAAKVNPIEALRAL